MNDDEQIIETLRTFGYDHIADRFEALVAEVASLRANEGRVPVSWDECADWLDAGQQVYRLRAKGWGPTRIKAEGFRRRAQPDVSGDAVIFLVGYVVGVLVAVAIYAMGSDS